VDERFKARIKLAETAPHATLLPEGNSETVTDLIKYYSVPMTFTGGFYTGIRLHFARMCDQDAWWKAMGDVFLQRYGDIFLLQARDDVSVPPLKLLFDGKVIKRLRTQEPRTGELRSPRARGMRLA